MENFKLKLYSKNSPSLASGSYKITVTQEVNVEKNKETYQNTSDYQVESSGYDIDSDIEKVFPVNGSTSNYEGYIPHIIFNNKALPWERGTPWMALLTLYDGEDFSIKSYSKDELRKLSNNHLLYDNDEFEKSSLSNFSILELSFQLFKSVAPTSGELFYLSHLREATLCSSQSTKFLQEKSLQSTENNPPKSSVILSNRLPGKGLNTMVLVSIEKLKELEEESEIENVQLIVLKKWSFESNTSNETFSTFLEKHVDANTFKLDSKAIKNTNVKRIIDAGYIPLNNNTKTNNAEFYRGPLMPMCLGQNTQENELEFKEHPAYQLGRLLCLQNKGIAEAVFNNRIENLRNATLQYEMNQKEVSLLRSTKVKSTLSHENISKGLHLNKLTDLLKKINASNSK